MLFPPWPPHFHWFRTVKVIGYWKYQECRCTFRRVRASLNRHAAYAPMDIAWVENRPEVIDPFGAVDPIYQVDPSKHRTVGLEEMLARAQGAAWPPP